MIIPIYIVTLLEHVLRCLHLLHKSVCQMYAKNIVSSLLSSGLSNYDRSVYNLLLRKLLLIKIPTCMSYCYGE